MQKSIIKSSIIAFSLLILSLSVFAQQQYELKISYDKFDDTTTILGRKVSLMEDITQVSVQPVATYKGQKASEMEARSFYLAFSYVSVSKSTKERQRFQGTDLIVLTDSNERIAGKLNYWRETSAEVIGSSGVDVGGFSTYTYLLKIDSEQIKKIANSKSAEVRWYGRIKDYTLNASAISSIKELVDFFKNKEAKEQ